MTLSKTQTLLLAAFAGLALPGCSPAVITAYNGVKAGAAPAPRPAVQAALRGEARSLAGPTQFAAGHSWVQRHILADARQLNPYGPPSARPPQGAPQASAPPPSLTRDDPLPGPGGARPAYLPGAAGAPARAMNDPIAALPGAAAAQSLAAANASAGAGKPASEPASAPAKPAAGPRERRSDAILTGDKPQARAFAPSGLQPIVAVPQLLSPDGFDPNRIF